jgi:hypothetical protein
MKTTGGAKSRPANPGEVATVWGQRATQSPRRTQTRNEGGVAYGRDNSPTAYIADSPSIYASGPDARTIEQQLRARALPVGLTDHNIAGYLYFPIAGPRRKTEVSEFVYTPRTGESISLRVR